MTSFSERHNRDTVNCDHCKNTVKPIIKRVDIAMVGATNVDFCPHCNQPTRSSWSLSPDEIENATVSNKPKEDGWLNYLGKGCTEPTPSD